MKEIKKGMKPAKNDKMLEAQRLVLKAGREVAEELDAKYKIDPKDHPLNFLSGGADRLEEGWDKSERTPKEIREMSEATRNPAIEARVVRKQAQKMKKKEKKANEK